MGQNWNLNGILKADCGVPGKLRNRIAARRADWRLMYKIDVPWYYQLSTMLAENFGKRVNSSGGVSKYHYRGACITSSHYLCIVFK